MTTILRLPSVPTIKDLYPYSSISLKKKRMRKKFARQHFKYIPYHIFCEYFGKVMSRPLRRSLNYAELGRNIIQVKESYKYDKTICGFFVDKRS